MDGTLGVAPRHAYDTKFASWLVSQQFAATTLRRLRGGPWKRRAVSCEKTQAPGKRPDLCISVRNLYKDAEKENPTKSLKLRKKIFFRLFFFCRGCLTASATSYTLSNFPGSDLNIANVTYFLLFLTNSFAHL